MTIILNFTPSPVQGTQKSPLGRTQASSWFWQWSPWIARRVIWALIASKIRGKATVDTIQNTMNMLSQKIWVGMNAKTERKTAK